MDNYYERYWGKKYPSGSGEIPVGISGGPPQWQEKDLLRIFTCLAGITLGRILDVGSGDGYFADRVSRLKGSGEVFGIDISETAINKAKINYPTLNFSQGQIESLAFSDSFFDTVFAIEVLEHIVDVQRAIEELRRVLKKGGYLAITTTDFNLLKRLIIAAFFFRRYFAPTHPHIRFFDRKSLSDLLIKNGFSICRYRWHGSYLGLMPKGQILIARKC
jgi:2-polyprenyl-3-methyl-5-hydroxy-6-metoxy-1,4-benzoquinol methylase